MKACSCGSRDVKACYMNLHGHAEYWMECADCGKKASSSPYTEEHATAIWNNDSYR